MNTTRLAGISWTALVCLPLWTAPTAMALEDRAVTVSYWTGPAVGTWQTASSWTPVGVPMNNGADLFDVVIDPETDQMSVVTLSGAVQINLLWVTEGDALFLANNSTLALAGPHTTFDGIFEMKSVGNGTYLRLDANVILGGTGMLSTSNSQANILYAPGGGRLTVGEDLTIRGSMQIGLNQLLMTNHGLIQAELSNGLLIDLTDAGPNYNDGTIGAALGSTLTIHPATLDNTGGLIAAQADSFVHLNGCTIVGGVLRDVDGPGPGAVRNVGAAALSGVTVEGELNGNNNTTTYLYNDIDLQGPFRLNSVGNGTWARVYSSPFVLGGTGGIVGSNSQANIVTGVAADTQLVIPVGSQIRGSMQVGLNQLLLDNHGLVQADLPQGMTLDLTDAGPNYNDGTIGAATGSTLTIHPASLDNTGGVIAAQADSFVHLTGCTIIGGVLRDVDGSGAGAVRNVGASALSGVTIEGEFNGNNNTTTYLYDDIDLQGPFRLNSVGNGTWARIYTSPFVLGGTGGIVGSNSQANIVTGVAGDTRLVIPIGSNVRGSLQLGLNQLLMDNHGLVQADAPQGMTLDLTDTGTSYNDGTIGAAFGSTLTIHPGTLDNAGGVIAAQVDAFVHLNGCTVLGGILRDVDGPGPGAVRNVGAIALSSVTVEGEFNCNNNTTAYLYGGIDTQGPVKLNSVGNGTYLRVQTSPFVIAGPGGVACSDSLGNIIVGLDPAHMVTIGPDSMLRGGCQFGQNTVGLKNQGTILADKSQGILIDPADALGFTNEGLIHLTSGNVSLQTGNFTNSGSIVIDAGRTCTRTGSYTQTAGVTTVNGLLTVNAPVSILGGILGGSGQVIGAVTNTSGTIAPGNSAGQLSFSNPFTQGIGGTFSVEIGGATPGTEHDRLAVTGNATLAGTLQVARINGFAPANGASFTVLTCTGTRTGTFSAVESCDPVDVIYGPQSVTVQYAGSFGIVGDLNHDGVVDGADLGALLGDWGACDQQCCPGDLNGDSVVDGADLGTLLGNWG